MKFCYECGQPVNNPDGCNWDLTCDACGNWACTEHLYIVEYETGVDSFEVRQLCKRHAPESSREGFHV